MAISTESGETLWTAPLSGLAQPETLAIHKDGVFVQIGNSVVCLDKASGKETWVYEAAAEKKGGADPKKGPQARNKKRKPAAGTWSGGHGRHVLVVSDGVVLCNLPEGLVAVSAKEGKKLWHGRGGSGFKAPLDLFVIDGKVWTGDHPGDPAPPPIDDFNVVRDLHTGKVTSTNDTSVHLQSQRFYRAS